MKVGFSCGSDEANGSLALLAGGWLPRAIPATYAFSKGVAFTRFSPEYRKLAKEDLLRFLSLELCCIDMENVAK